MFGLFRGRNGESLTRGNGIAEDIDSFIVEELEELTSICIVFSLGVSLIEISSDCFMLAVDTSLTVSSLNDTDRFFAFSNRVRSVNEVLLLFTDRIERNSFCLVVLDETWSVESSGFFIRRGSLNSYG